MNDYPETSEYLTFQSKIYHKGEFYLYKIPYNEKIMNK